MFTSIRIYSFQFVSYLQSSIPLFTMLKSDSLGLISCFQRMCKVGLWSWNEVMEKSCML